MTPHVADDSTQASTSSIESLEAESITCTSHYKTIKVQRHADFIQVILIPNYKDHICFFTLQSLSELTEIVHMTNQDPRLHTLILNGVGKSFCYGLDTSPLIEEQKTTESKNIAYAVKDFIEALSDLKKPFAVIVNGAAKGLAVTMLSHADTIIASENATFSMPQSGFGYFPEGGATLTLPRAVGATLAMDLVMRGRTVTAQEGKSIGLVSEIISEDQIPDEIIARVKHFRAISLTNFETSKAMMNLHLRPQLLSVLENEVKILPQMWLSDSCQLALTAAHKQLELDIEKEVSDIEKEVSDSKQSESDSKQSESDNKQSESDNKQSESDNKQSESDNKQSDSGSKQSEPVNKRPEPPS